MSNDPSPLKYMGTQSHETMAMEAALALRAARRTGQAADIAAEGTPVSDSTRWPIDKAKDILRSAAGSVGERATTTLKTHIREDPMKAVAISAGIGAVLMGLAAMMARSGARRIMRRSAQR